MDEPTTALSAARERAAVRADPPAPRRGPRHHLHLPPHGRGLRARRPRHRAARRRLVGTLDSWRSAPTRIVRMMVGRDLSRSTRRSTIRRPGEGTCCRGRGMADGAARQGLLASTSMRARSSARRPGRRRPHRACAADLSAPTPKTARRGRARGQARRDPHARRGHRRRHRLSDRGPQGARPVPRHVVPATTSISACSAATPRLGGSSNRAKARDARQQARSRRSRIRAANVGVTVGRPVRRQPAEGAAVAAACDQAEGADPRRADARRRHRRQVGDLLASSTNLAAPASAILVISSRTARDHRHLRPRPGHARGHIAGEVERAAASPINQEDIMALATGVAASKLDA